MHPLRATIERCQRHYPYLALELEATSGLGWVLTPILAQTPTAVAHVIAHLSRQFHTTDRRYLTGLLLINHLQQLCAAGILAIMVARRCPLLGVDQVALRYTAQGAVGKMVLLRSQFYALEDDAAADHPDMLKMDNEAALWDYLSRAIEAHAALLIPTLQAEIATSGVKVGDKVLWLILADQIASQTIYLAKGVGQVERAPAIVAALVARPGSALCGKTGVVSIEADGKVDYFVERSSCCFIYIAKDASGRPLNRCLTCPAYARVQRQALLQNYMRRYTS